MLSESRLCAIVHSMIPLKLQLRNFLSYGDSMQTIDFAPYQFICLSGKNGHGKSALLDAITWAVWGQARKIGMASRADEGLLRLGSRAMCVIFDFSCKGVTYRVRRELALTKADRSYTVLEFGMVDHANSDAIVALTAKTIRQTQEAIERTIGLTFDSFVNSVFLRQGQSNEFSKKTAKERKEILAAILGVDEFELLREKALEKIRDSLAERDSFGKLQERLSVELGRLDSVRVAVIQLQQQHDDVEARLRDFELQRQKLDAARICLSQHEQKCALAHAAYKQLHDHEQQLRQQLLHAHEEWKLGHRVRVTQTGSAHVHEQLQLVRVQEQLLRQQAVRHLQGSQSVLVASQSLAQYIQQKELTRERAKSQVAIELAELKQQHKQLLTQQQHGQARVAQLMNEHAQLGQQLAELATELTQNQVHAQGYIAARHVFEKRREMMVKVAEHVERVGRECARVGDQLACFDDACKLHCPLCKQKLIESRAQVLREQLRVSHSFYQHRYKRLCTFVSDVRPLVESQACELESAASSVVHLERLKEREVQLKNRAAALKQELDDQAREFELKQEQVRNFAQQMLLREQDNEKSAFIHESGDEVQEKLKSEHQEKKRELDAIGYDASVHQHVQEQLLVLEQQYQAIQHVSDQQAQQAQRLTYLCGLIDQVRRACVEKTVREREHQECVRLCSQAKQEVRAFELLCVQHDEVSKQAREMLATRARAEQELERLEAVAHEHKKHAQRIKELENDIWQYRAIALALGKDGIQALLIDSVVPELEQEANTLLARLSDNNAQIFIESLRDLKSGGTRETLDINISDSAGIRPYELFSGGEAFRIDFSLRVALSKLLARRAGAALQTLIIDEGFGSQDEEGLSRIMDALMKVQDDFAKVIVVSHLASFKEQFPVQFVVEKDATGSRVTVFEQN